MKKNTGLTLIELLVTITILSIIVGVGMPSFSWWFSNRSAKPVGKMIEKTVQLARVEAIKRGRIMEIVPSHTNWVEGWQIQFDDGTGNKEVLRVFPAPPSTIVLQQVTPGTPKFTISPSGQTSSSGFQFILKNNGCTGNSAVKYTVMVSGLLSKETVSC